MFFFRRFDGRMKKNEFQLRKVHLSIKNTISSRRRVQIKSDFVQRYNQVFRLQLFENSNFQKVTWEEIFFSQISDFLAKNKHRRVSKNILTTLHYHKISDESGFERKYIAKTDVFMSNQSHKSFNSS